LVSVSSWGKSVDTRAIIEQSADNWLSYGKDYREQRYSELNQINRDNLSRLGLAWSFDTDFDRGLEATPIVVDGVIYVTGNWSMVYALDARDGSLLWKYDPKVPREWGKMACCDVVNRGVAFYEGKVFVGTLDARLVALDAQSGEVVWDVQTADIKKYPYTITGAPRAAKGKVFIGNGGAEYGVRGFVSAFDVNTGELAWRFYTVPGNPADGFESEAMSNAADTWTGEWWNHGGGGTVWDSIVYDHELDQLLIGVGNGSPWNRRIRSPEGGDNLYLSSIVSLNPDSGEYNWHYQETPAETWDYTATQHIMLADVEREGEKVPVIWQAPKNGFFFVIDRRDGKLLSAEPYSIVTWATHYDMQTGRPVEAENADYSDGPTTIYPSSGGAHNWQPMAHHPNTGLVYLLMNESPYRYENVEHYKHNWGHWNTGSVMDQGSMPDLRLLHKVMPKMSRGYLQAWNPVTQKEAWRVPLALPWAGGMLTSGDNLLFHGNSENEFAAYAADSGEKLWGFDTQVGVIGSPVTYTVDGEQYVTVAAGWGGALGLIAGFERLGGRPEKGRILTFKLDGKASLPPVPGPAPRTQPPARISEDDALIARGRLLYLEYCMGCHGSELVGHGSVPDLRHLPQAFYDNFDAIVLDGIMRKAGMVGFSDVLTKDDTHAIKAYVLDEANKEWEILQQPAWWQAVVDKVYDSVASLLVWAMDWSLPGRR
jgi:quinohemoprotein ethanol dehydrogenase